MRDVVGTQSTGTDCASYAFFNKSKIQTLITVCIETYTVAFLNKYYHIKVHVKYAHVTSAISYLMFSHANMTFGLAGLIK